VLATLPENIIEKHPRLVAGHRHGQQIAHAVVFASNHLAPF